MKPSQVIKEALNHYYYTGNKDEYMCHAIGRVECSHEDKRAARGTFMPLLEANHTGCLTVYLKSINYKGKYWDLVERYGHYTKSTYNLRLIWWNDHIAMLEAKGL